MNFGKSFVLLSPNVHPSLCESIETVLGVRSVADPSKYLELSIVVGMNKTQAFRSIRDQFVGHIDSWVTRYLSQGEKLICIKSIL